MNSINGLTIKELKALLSDIESELSIIDSEAAICNNIAKSFSGKVYTVEYNKKLKADIQIQLDILDFMNNGGIIKTASTTGRLNSKPVKGAKAGMKLFRKGFVA